MQAADIKMAVEVGPANCVDSIYNVDIRVDFEGFPEAMVLSGADLAADTKVTLLMSPAIYTISGLKDAGTGAAHQVKVSVYNDAACTQIVASMTLNFTAPDYICTKTHVLDACLDEWLTLSSSFEGDVYEWSTDESTRSIRVKESEETTKTYSVRTYRTTMELKDNLMANGGFESNPPTGFSSDYNYVGWNPTEYYADHSGAANLYAIIDDAEAFWHDYAPVKAHSGDYFALFDAGKDGYAWRASTVDNPALKIEQDTTYIFSYWAAYPNKTANNSPAILQFMISYKGADGQMHEEKLGKQYRLGQEEELNGWYQQIISWKAPVSSDSVIIGVYDKNESAGGNDFALDDIMFQSTHSAEMLLAFEDVYEVHFKPCDPPTPPTPPTPDPDPDPDPTPEPCVGGIVWAKWNDVVFVDNSDSLYVSYQWYKDSIAVAGATEQYYRDLEPTRGAYYVEIVLRDGKKIHTCELDFTDIPRSADYINNVQKVSERRVYYVTDRFRIVQLIYEDGHVETHKQLLLCE